MPCRPSNRRALAVAAVSAAAALLLTGCSGSSPSATATAKPTPITRLDAAALHPARAAFCTDLPQSAVDDAVDGRAGRGESWRNGDQAQVESGAREVDDAVHEYGCRWTSGDSVATAWVFAPALTTAQAQAVIDKTGTRRGCTSTDGPGFGSPDQRQTCTRTDGSTRVRVAGLFTDTWVSCEVSDGAGVSAAAVSRRTDAWCVQVVDALGGRGVGKG